MSEPITLYADDHGFTMIDFPDHVELQDGPERYMVLVSSIFDNGEHVGPENTEAVCPNVEKAHAFIERRFNSRPLRAERHGDDPFSPHRVFAGKLDLNLTICARLIALEDQ